MNESSTHQSDFNTDICWSFLIAPCYTHMKPDSATLHSNSDQSTLDQGINRAFKLRYITKSWWTNGVSTFKIWPHHVSFATVKTHYLTGRHLLGITSVKKRKRHHHSGTLCTRTFYLMLNQTVPITTTTIMILCWYVLPVISVNYQVNLTPISTLLSQQKIKYDREKTLSDITIQMKHKIATTMLLTTVMAWVQLF